MRNREPKRVGIATSHAKLAPLSRISQLVNENRQLAQSVRSGIEKDYEKASKEYVERHKELISV